MMPLSAEEVRSILASKRIPADGGEVDNIVDTVRKQIRDFVILGRQRPFCS